MFCYIIENWPFLVLFLCEELFENIFERLTSVEIIKTDWESFQVNLQDKFIFLLFGLSVLLEFILMIFQDITLDLKLNICHKQPLILFQ